MHQDRPSTDRVVPRPLLIGLLLAGLAGCAGGPEPREAVYEMPPAEPGQTPAAVAPPPVDTGVRQAGNSLLVEARQARESGDFNRADALLQRAQRIDPTNAGVYLGLAELYVLRGQDAAARSVAERGLLYCQGQECDRLRDVATR